MKKNVLGFTKNEDGLVVIEWIGIAAVLLVAAITIFLTIGGGLNTAGGNLTTSVAGVGDVTTPEITEAAITGTE